MRTIRRKSSARTRLRRGFRTTGPAGIADVPEPLVTFVVPNYNGARFLHQTLASILGQKDPEYLLILADNQSTDDSIGIAESFGDPRLSIASSERHLSMSENWNR